VSERFASRVKEPLVPETNGENDPACPCEFVAIVTDVDAELFAAGVRLVLVSDAVEPAGNPLKFELAS
jgi:hypothetical protein